MKWVNRLLLVTMTVTGLLWTATPVQASIVPVSVTAAVQAPQAELVWGQKVVMLPTCSSTGICFYANPDNLPLTGFSQSIARGVCRSVPDNHTAYIENNTTVRWWVFQTTDCTGIRAPVYPRTSGYMAGMWYLTIGSTYRTAMTS